MTAYVYVEADQTRLSQVSAAYREHGFSVVDSTAHLEVHLARHPETLLVIIGASLDLDEVLTFAAYQRVQRPALGVVLLRHEVLPDIVMRALRAGVREVIDERDGDAIRTSSARSVDLSKALGMTMRQTSLQAQNAKVVTVFAGKGGCGKSVIATNLAVALAAGGSRRVLLIDLDLQFGDVAIMLQLAPTRSITEGIAMAGHLDESGLRSLLTSYRPGIDALLAPASPAEAEHVSRDVITEVLEVARPLYDFIVIDTPPFVTDQVLAALDASHWYVPIVTPDLPTLKSVRLTLEMFDLLQYPTDRRIVVFNRANSEVGLSVTDVEAAVGTRLAVHVPSSRDVTVSVNKGVPLALSDPTHPVSSAIRHLADWTAEITHARAPRRRLLSFGRKVSR